MGDLFRGSLSNDGTALIAALRTEIDDPVRTLDDIEVMLDDNDGVARIHNAFKHGNQTLDVIGMKTGGRFIENIDGLAGRLLLQFRSAVLRRRTGWWKTGRA